MIHAENLSLIESPHTDSLCLSDRPIFLLFLIIESQEWLMTLDVVVIIVHES